jgi:hypothetical protein
VQQDILTLISEAKYRSWRITYLDGLKKVKCALYIEVAVKDDDMQKEIPVAHVY